MKKNLILRLPSISFFLLILAVVFYIEVPAFGKPYYFITPVVLVLSLYSILKNGVMSSNDLILSAVISILAVVLLLKAFGSNNFFEHLYVFNIFILPATLFLGVKIKTEVLVKCLKYWFSLSFAIFAIELWVRLSNPIIGGHIVSPSEAEDSSFYAYKINSLMYSNSNGIGMHALFMLGFLFTLYGIRGNYQKAFNIQYGLTKKFFWYSFLFLILFILGSLSRAAIAVSFVMVIFFLFMRASMSVRMLILALSVFLLGFGLLNYSNIIYEDESFSTKFDIFFNLINYLKEANSLYVFFGNTLDPPTVKYNFFDGTVGHTHYFELIFKLGFFFSLFYVLMILLVSVRAGFISTFTLLIFILIGFSNVRLFGHYLFFVFGLVYIYSFHFRRFSGSSK